MVRNVNAEIGVSYYIHFRRFVSQGGRDLNPGYLVKVNLSKGLTSGFPAVETMTSWGKGMPFAPVLPRYD